MPAITRNLLLLTLFSAFFLISYGQKQSGDSLQAVLNQMAKTGIYEISHVVGFSGTIFGQQERFKQLLLLATPRQLEELAARHNNAVVRLYAFQALRQKRAGISKGLLEQFQGDHTIVITLEGCLGNKKTVSALVGQQLHPAYDLTNR